VQFRSSEPHFLLTNFFTVRKAVSYEPTIHIVLHQPEIPPNTGNIGRTCVALQAKLWLVKPLGFEITKKTLRRAGLDYWQHLSWQTVEDWDDLCQKIPAERFWLFSRFATKNYLTADYRSGDALIFGCETAGLPAEITQQYPDSLLRIETHENVRSINLSNAVAVAGFEAHRQILS
jgi:tRNA (cytidine/uridine-2'-O-)-methyltransferase